MTASRVGDVEWVKLLLNAGAQVNAKTPTGWTALHAAAAKGKPDVVQALLAAGAVVNPKCLPDGFTPLRFAKDEQVAQLLRRHGGTLL